jgi:hypothetical protein
MGEMASFFVIEINFDAVKGLFLGVIILKIRNILIKKYKK